MLFGYYPPPQKKKKNHISFTSYFSPTCLCSILQWFHTAPVWAPLPHIITHYHYYASNSIWIANIIICVSNFYWPRKYWWNCCDRRWKVITSDNGVNVTVDNGFSVKKRDSFSEWRSYSSAKLQSAVSNITWFGETGKPVKSQTSQSDDSFITPEWSNLDIKKTI